jgi:HEAT repeat protein
VGAAKALGKIGGPEAIAALEDAAANDPEEVVRKFANEALDDL